MVKTDYDKRHGSPWDRGSADSYYRRDFRPHYFKGATYNSERVDEQHMTADELAAYKAGYYENEESGNFKDWG